MITKSAFFPSHCLRVFLPENSRFHSSNHGDINEITDTQCNGVKLLLKLRKVVIDGMACQLPSSFSFFHTKKTSIFLWCQINF